jgi:transglutaminase-like putative cysteine protease
VSRREFRSRVAAPRPASAWALVLVASASLWITEQLEPWVVLVQAAVLLGTLLCRARPLALQRSPLLLNLGMAGVSATTIAVALRGQPSSVALAHFAALAQALQLLDARPRKSEFLLVTLALFQVVLASSLTDSVLFPPLLAAFAVAAVWTLLVHTLRMEAAEDGDADAVTRAITPGLWRTTLLASSLSMPLALAFFVALPRLHSSVVSGRHLGLPLAAAGFSDTVTLGELGRIRRDPRTVLRIETLEGSPLPREAAYWRGLAFDHFDGERWSITPQRRSLVAGSPEAGVTLGSRPSEIDLVQRIVREPVAAGVVFGAGEVRALAGTLRRLERDENGGLYAPEQAEARVRYEVSSFRREWSDAELAARAALPPRGSGARYLQLPPLAPELRALAEEIGRGAGSDAERVRAVERFLLEHGRYQDTPPVPPPGARSPVEAFLLGELAGHCEYFASGMVVLLRSLSLPARLVNGFAGGRENRIGDFVELSRSDAHAWVEVHYEGAGWVRYDPTPADLRARAPAAASLGERVRELASALELWWYQRVVGFDRADQIRAAQRAWLAWKGRRRSPEQSALPASDGRRAARAPGWLQLLAGGAALLAGALLLLRRIRARRREALPAGYARALRLLARRGLRRAPCATARGFAEQVEAALGAPVGEPFHALTEAYLAERFGGRPAPAGAPALAALCAALARRGRAGGRIPRRSSPS